MSSFLKQGKRDSEIKQKKYVKKRIKRIYYIIAEIKRVFDELMIQTEVEITEDNIVEEAKKISKVIIGEYEGFMLKGKLHEYNKSKDEEE